MNEEYKSNINCLKTMESQQAQQEQAKPSIKIKINPTNSINVVKPVKPKPVIKINPTSNSKQQPVIKINPTNSINNIKQQPVIKINPTVVKQQPVVKQPVIKINPTVVKQPVIKINPTNSINILPKQQQPNNNQQQPKNNRVNAGTYERYDSTREHIYNITDTYVGSDEKMSKHERVMDLNSMCFRDEEITLPEAVERIFIEISSNAGDNVARSLRNGVNPGEVEIKMDRNTISVRNGGIPIPIEIHPKYKIWVAELIMGKLHSSSNYDKSRVRTECGRNGYGAKLTNIFSKIFTITIGDHHNKKWYKQTWTENMTIVNEPEIKPYNGPSFVEITYVMDFERFGYVEYPDEAFRLYARHAADMSFTGKVPVSFNGVKFHVQNSLDYAKLYFGDTDIKNNIVYYKWPQGTKTITKKGITLSQNKGVVPEIEICAIDTPDASINVSFVNGMWTRLGGVHADAAFKAVALGIVEKINTSKDRKEKKNDKKGNKKSQKKSVKLTLKDVKKHVSLFVSCWIGNPKFDSQLKTALRSPAIKIVIDPEILEPISNWELVHRLYAELDAKSYKILSKTDGKKRKYVNVTKGKDANNAGGANSLKCTLYIVEGNSAGGFAEKMMCLFEKGRDTMGVYPLKGKPINVMKAPAEQIAENVEIEELKTMLGLREGVNYLLDENFKTLRYGRVVFIPDSDVDGKHILGLGINYFHCRQPTLLARGYVNYLKTKIIDVQKGKQHFKFYTTNEYNNWKNVTPNYQKWEHNYFKGLGSSEDSDIVEEFQNPRYVACIYDDIAPMTISLAFDREMADRRKDWIKNWVPNYDVEDMQYQPISAFINHEMIQYSIEDLARSLPRFMDGMKRTQRKILWGCLQKWGATICKSGAKKVKVATLGSYVSELTNYHHGEKSINDAITKMVQDFVGSNNLPYLFPHGQFGTRDKKGKDASAPRYTHTKPQWWWMYIYKKEDLPLLEMEMDEGATTEPVTFLPIIPMQLVNGAQGIGTGHSTFIPNHNPLDICNWLISKIKGEPLQAVIPWYKGFKGEIEIKERKSKKKVVVVENNDEVNEGNSNSNDEVDEANNDVNEANNDDSLEEEDRIEIDENTKYTMLSKGVFKVTGKIRKKVIITELPIGRGTDEYEKWLGELREKKIITSVTAQSVDNGVYLEITGMKNPSLKNLKLIRSFGLSNMVLLDNFNRPIKYSSSYEILDSFYHLRLPFYEKRKKNVISEIEKRSELLTNKIRFIKAVIAGYELIKTNPNITIEEANEQGCLLVMNKRKNEIILQTEALRFPEDLMKKVTLHSCTYEEVIAAMKELEKRKLEKEELEKISAKELWLHDLNEFVAAYCKHYKCSAVSPKNKLTLNITK